MNLSWVVSTSCQLHLVEFCDDTDPSSLVKRTAHAETNLQWNISTSDICRMMSCYKECRLLCKWVTTRIIGDYFQVLCRTFGDELYTWIGCYTQTYSFNTLHMYRVLYTCMGCYTHVRGAKHMYGVLYTCMNYFHPWTDIHRYVLYILLATHRYRLSRKQIVKYKSTTEGQWSKSWPCPGASPGWKQVVWIKWHSEGDWQIQSRPSADLCHLLLFEMKGKNWG